MLDAVNARANGVHRVDDLEMGRHRNAARVRCFGHDLDQTERQSEIDLDHRCALLDETIDRVSRLFGVTNDERVRRVCGRRRVQMRAGEKQPRYWRARSLCGVISFDPLPRIAHGRDAARQK
jgi:hypothetical protein